MQIDAASTAQQLAQLYVSARQTQVDTQNKTAQARLEALNKLQTALQTFNGLLAKLSGKGSLLEKLVTASATNVTATASANAVAGTYKLFVERLATAHQVSYNVAAGQTFQVKGALTVSQDNGASFNVDLTKADYDASGALTLAEVARAINESTGNAGKLTAQVVTAADGSQKLLLTAAETGAKSKITVTPVTSTNNANRVDAKLSDALKAPTDVTTAQDAVVWLGDQTTGVKFVQASNTFTGIQGLTVQLQKAQAAGEAPVELKVTENTEATKANVRSLVDAFNELAKVLDDLTISGSAAKGIKAGVFATDSGIRVLRNRLNAILRQPFEGVIMNDLGLSADGKGKLTLNEARLEKFLAANKDGVALNKFFGKATATTSSGLLGALDGYIDSWTQTTGGQIGRRRDSVQQLQKTLTKQQVRIDLMYEQAYTRYLKQFSALQTLQAQMDQTSGALQSMPTFNFTATN